MFFSRISWIIDLFGSEQPELYALELENFVMFDFVYTLAIKNIHQSTPQTVSIYIDLIIKSQMSLVGPE